MVLWTDFTIFTLINLATLWYTALKRKEGSKTWLNILDICGLWHLPDLRNLDLHHWPDSVVICVVNKQCHLNYNSLIIETNKIKCMLTLIFNKLDQFLGKKPSESFIISGFLVQNNKKDTSAGGSWIYPCMSCRSYWRMPRSCRK